jgi:hypothetical protein
VFSYAFDGAIKRSFGLALSVFQGIMASTAPDLGVPFRPIARIRGGILTSSIAAYQHRSKPGDSCKHILQV